MGKDNWYYIDQEFLLFRIIIICKEMIIKINPYVDFIINLKPIIIS